MARKTYVSSRKFMHVRIAGLREFFLAYYGPSYQETLAQLFKLPRACIRNQLTSSVWGRLNGIVRSEESARMELMQLLEQHAVELGWQCPLKVQGLPDVTKLSVLLDPEPEQAPPIDFSAPRRDSHRHEVVLTPQGLVGTRARPVLAFPVGGGAPTRWPSGAAYGKACNSKGRAVGVCVSMSRIKPAFGYWWVFEGSDQLIDLVRLGHVTADDAAKDPVAPSSDALS
jgi:hypothetical protein